VETAEVTFSEIEAYGRVPISFTVKSILELELQSGGIDGIGIKLTNRAVPKPYPKDYDADPDSRPTAWSKRFDTSNWGLIAARSHGELVAGIALAFGSPNLDLLDRRTDLAVLWDLRVEPSHRRKGLGAALFSAAEDWARERNCRQLKVETQNVNVPACRFYQAQGCQLGGFNQFAYPDQPSEVQLLWYKSLSSSAA